MKTKLAVLVLILTFSSQPGALHAQGSLTPPGPPALTMKSLDQIEARTPISSAPFTITSSGSYYLTTNISVTAGDAITITANGVSLDLNGFTISSTEVTPTGTGILLAGGNTDITILNGHIRGSVTENHGVYSGSGFANGIYSSGPSLNPANVRVAGISVSGCLHYGIFLLDYDSTVVESCTVKIAGNDGIEASCISHSTAVGCGGFGINARTASDCYGSCTSGGAGVFAINAQNCNGSSAGAGNGVQAHTANNCYGDSISGQGIRGEIANNCSGYSSENRGVFVDIAIGCEGQSGGSSWGLYALFMANACYGKSDTGIGLSANIAIACVGVNNSGPSVIYNSHYNMPP